MVFECEETKLFMKFYIKLEKNKRIKEKLCTEPDFLNLNLILIFLSN